MRKIVILLSCLIPGISFAYSGELEIQKLQFQVDQLDNFQDKYTNLVTQIVIALLGLFGAIITLNWFQNFKLGKKEIDNIRKELENSFKNEVDQLKDQNTKAIDELKKVLNDQVDTRVNNKLSQYKGQIYDIRFALFKEKSNKRLNDFIEQIGDSSEHDTLDLSDVLDMLEDFLKKNNLLQEDKYELNENLVPLVNKYSSDDPFDIMVRNKTKSLIKQLGDLD